MSNSTYEMHLEALAEAARLSKSATARIAAAATTVVLGAPGVLESIQVECGAGGGAMTGTATVYDNTLGAGTVIAILAIGTPLGTPFHFDRVVSNGITIVTTTNDRLIVRYKAAA